MTYNVDQFLSLVSQNGGMARSNLYLVQLPDIKEPVDPTGPDGPVDPNSGPSIMRGDELNILCKATQIPGRQLLSTERRIGMQTTKVAYGYQVEDINLTFHVTNDYKIRKYFDRWQQLAINTKTQDVGYFDDYKKTISIMQIRKGIGFPIWRNNFPGWYDDIPSNIKNRLPELPWPKDLPFKNPIDLRQGEIDLAFITPEMTTYTIDLLDAYPTSLSSIDLNNEMDGLIELSVSLSYRNWLDRDDKKGDQEGVTGIIAQILSKLNIF